MMSEAETKDINYVKDMVDSLSQGDNIGAEKAFKDALAGKISAALDTKRTDVAQSWLNEPQEMPTDETPQEIEVTSDVPSDEKPEIAEPGEDPMVQKLADQEKLSPRMKKAIDDLFKSSDSIDKIDTNIDRVAKQYGVSKSKIMAYLDKETLR